MATDLNSYSSWLISGGTGSLGNALTEHLLETHIANRIVIYSRDEWKQAEMAEKFSRNRRLRFFIGDVRDRERLKRAMWRTDIVVHAAALKRVDSVSYNPDEVIKTNVLGTINVVDAAMAAGVKKVLVISSDKAVNPQNMYGATKMLAEAYSVTANAYSGPRSTLVSAVRYGNVLGSRGSVVEIFRKALREGRPVPITDLNCTRFWITLKEACRFILRSVEQMAGGEIFVPKLSSMRIIDLAEIIAPGMAQSINGLRPGGEKLHEALLTDEEIGRTIEQNGSFIVLPGWHGKGKGTNWQGTALPQGFQYTSEKTSRIEKEKMLEMLRELP